MNKEDIQDFANAWMRDNKSSSEFIIDHFDRVSIEECGHCLYKITIPNNIGGVELHLLSILLNDDSFINGFRCDPALVSLVPFTFIIGLD